MASSFSWLACKRVLSFSCFNFSVSSSCFCSILFKATSPSRCVWPSLCSTSSLSFDNFASSISFSLRTRCRSTVSASLASRSSWFSASSASLRASSLVAVCWRSYKAVSSDSFSLFKLAIFSAKPRFSRSLELTCTSKLDFSRVSSSFSFAKRTTFELCLSTSRRVVINSS